MSILDPELGQFRQCGICAIACYCLLLPASRVQCSAPLLVAICLITVCPLAATFHMCAFWSVSRPPPPPPPSPLISATFLSQAAHCHPGLPIFSWLNSSSPSLIGHHFIFTWGSSFIRHFQITPLPSNPINFFASEGHIDFR